MIIRKATKRDAAAIAPCLLLAMEPIVYGFIGAEDSEKALAFMLHFSEREANQYSYENCWVAEVNEEVVAAANVYDGAQLHALRRPVLAYLKSEFNNGLQPEDETAAGEFYIDAIGVKPAHQGNGAGTQLLQFLLNEYAVEGGQPVGLLVDAGNRAASRLYQKLGFKAAGKKTLLGKPMEHLQFKSPC